MSSKLLSRIKVGVLAGVFALAQAIVPAQAALASPGGGNTDTGTPQPVWCQYTNIWEAQLGNAGSDNNQNRVALKSLPEGAASDMYVDTATGQVYSPNGSFDALKTALDAECYEQQNPTDPTNPTDPVEPTDPEEPPVEVNYCNPAPATGSVADWVPADVDCVTLAEPAVECGSVNVGINNKTEYNTWGVAWSEGEEGVDPVFHADNSMPATFAEDYNGGSVTVHYWLVGPEGDYLEGRPHIPNFWDRTYGTVTVDTDCEENVKPTPPAMPYVLDAAVCEQVNIGRTTWAADAGGVDGRDKYGDNGEINADGWGSTLRLYAAADRELKDITLEFTATQGFTFTGATDTVSTPGAGALKGAGYTEAVTDHEISFVDGKFIVTIDSMPAMSSISFNAPIERVEGVDIYMDSVMRGDIVGCEVVDPVDPTTDPKPPVDEPKAPVVGPGVNVQGASTDTPRQVPANDVAVLPATLPQTGAADSANPLVILLAGALAYGVLYFAQSRRNYEM